jgi:hypothetical protein
MRARRISTAAEQERQLRDTAIGEAAELFARHGSHAAAIVSDRLVDQSRTPEQRRADRLALLEVERLDRTRRQGPSNTALVVWKPSVWSRIASLFGVKARRRA